MSGVGQPFHICPVAQPTRLFVDSIWKLIGQGGLLLYQALGEMGRFSKFLFIAHLDRRQVS